MSSQNPMGGGQKDFLKGLLSNFMFSLGQGIQASAQARPQESAMAGFGASLQAPEILREQKLKEEQARAQMAMEQERLALQQRQVSSSENMDQYQAANIMDMIRQRNQPQTPQLPAEVQLKIDAFKKEFGEPGFEKLMEILNGPTKEAAPISLPAGNRLVSPAGEIITPAVPQEEKPPALIPGRDIPYPPDVEAQRKRMSAAGQASVPSPELMSDPESQSILANTGLSLPAFTVLTGQTSQLSRDAATRKRAMAEAQEWANKRGVDISTMASQYKIYNEVLARNISRMNNTKIMESELQGTIQNLQGVIAEKDLGNLRFANVAKIWAGQEVNDPLAQQYAMHLYQLRNELAAYGAATQGRSGNEITIQDYNEAQNTIRNGISKGSLSGLATAVENSTEKMGTVMQKSVETARKAVWDLFGVGENYKGKGNGQYPNAPAVGTIKNGYKFKGGNPADKNNWEKQ